MIFLLHKGLCSLIFVSTIIITKAKLSSVQHNIISFNDQNLDRRKSDNIFILLADIDPKYDRLDHYGKISYINSIPLDEKGKDGQLIFQSYKAALNEYFDTEIIKDVLKTVGKASKIFEKQKEKIRKDFSFKKILKYSKNAPKTEGMLSSAAKAVGNILEPKNIDKVLEVAGRARDEGEILEQVSSVILGAEERGGHGYGHGLTLDPVTCIALIALAVYLIRAVFQIITMTTARKKRSIDDDIKFYLDDSDVPTVMTRFYDGLSNPEMIYSSSFTSEKERGNGLSETLINLPSEMVVALKMLLDRNQSCLRRIICIHLAGRKVSEFGFSEFFWGTIGLANQHKISEILQMKNRDIDRTCKTSQKHDAKIFQNRTGKVLTSEAHGTCSDTSFNDYLRLQTLFHKIFEEFFRRSGYLGPRYLLS